MKQARNHRKKKTHLGGQAWSDRTLYCWLLITRFHSNKWYDISIAQELTIPSNCDRIAELLAGRVIPSKWSLLKQNYNYPGKNHNQNFTRLTRLESIQMGFSRRSAYFHLYVRVNTMERTETITFQHYLNKIRIIFVGSCPLCYCHSLSLAPTRHSSQLLRAGNGGRYH